MREPVRAFVASAAKAFELNGPVYQFGIGQFGIGPNGELVLRSPLRDCFPRAAYVSIELDERVEIDRLPLADGAARTVLCIDALERTFEPQRTVDEMLRILAPGGTLLICAACEYPVSEPKPNYWRLTPRSVERLTRGIGATLIGWQGAEAFPHTIYGIGFKPPLCGAILEGTSRFLDDFQARLDEAAGHVGWPARLKRLLTGWTRSRSERLQRRDYHKVQFAVDLRVDQDPEHDLPPSVRAGKTAPRGRGG